MKTIPKLADEMRIYIASEKMENEEVLETLMESGDEEETALILARQKVGDVFLAYILPAEKTAKSKRLDIDGFFQTLLDITAKYPKEWKELRDKYEADGVTKHSPRLNAMIDKYEELETVLREMAEKAKEE